MTMGRQASLEAGAEGSGVARACGCAWARTWTKSWSCRLAGGSALAAWYVLPMEG